MSIMYITQKILINDELVEGIYSVDIPRPEPHFDFGQITFRYPEEFRMECWNKNNPNYSKYFQKKVEVKVIIESIKKLYLCYLINLNVNYEDFIFKSELTFQVVAIHEGSKCPYCKKYEMDLENTDKDGIVYNTCKACGQTWYEWDELNKGLEGKAIFNEKEVENK
ncbi:MAG: hypothetical protein ACFFG0_04920 [Candidatus Thorarchaeota archaeon]